MLKGAILLRETANYPLEPDEILDTLETQRPRQRATRSVEIFQYVLMITNPSVKICPSNVASNTLSKQVYMMVVITTILTVCFM